MFSINYLDLVEELVIQYIQDITKAALEFGRPGKISLEDLAYVIRNDKRKGKL
jgi:transcription initiation factor TFIID subunit 13